MVEEDEKKRFTYYVGVDFAISETQRSDYTALVVAGLDEEGFLYVVEVVKGRWGDGNEIIDQMFAIERAYHPEQWFLEEGAIRKALGAAFELRMRAEGETGLYMNMTLMQPHKEKTVRARNIQARMRARAVKFRTGDSWFAEFEDECTTFPRGKHDDCVDALAYIGLGLGRMSTPVSEEEELDVEFAAAKREAVSMGRSMVTGY